MMNLFEIDVPLWQWIVSQVLGVFAIIVFSYAMLQKTKSKELAWLSSGNLLIAIISLLLRNWMVVGIAGVAFFKNITFAVANMSGRSFSKRSMCVIFVVFSSLNISVSALTWHFVSFHILDAFLLTFVLLGNFAKAFLSLHYMKGANFGRATVLVFNNVLFRDLMNFIRNVMVIVSVITFYVMLVKKRRAAVRGFIHDGAAIDVHSHIIEDSVETVPVADET